MTTPSDPVEVLLAPVRPYHAQRRRSHGPILRTIFYTLDISARFLLRTLFGRGTVESGDRLLDGYWRRIFRSGNGSLRVAGRHHFAKGQAYIIMSNHASLLDIPALMGAIPGSMRMVMKQELARVPIWGPALVASGFVPIDRKNRERAIAQLEKAKEQIARGVNIWISPEGTRSRTGELAPFKKGGFHLAMDLGAPIIPTWIEGAQDIIPADEVIAILDGVCTVRFAAPIPTAGRAREELPALMEEVRLAVMGLREAAREEGGATVVPALSAGASEGTGRPAVV